MPEYSLNELATLADVTPRTIRFYIEQGLLPAPGSLGPKSRYTDEHLERLLLIKRFQAAHLPLAEIRNRLRSQPAEEPAVEPAMPSQSAVDYIRGVLGNRPVMAPAAQSVPPPAPAAAAATPRWTVPKTQTTEPERSQWERISLDPDIELHIRRPMTRSDNKRVARLIEYARQLFEED